MRSILKAGIAWAAGRLGMVCLDLPLPEQPARPPLDNLNLLMVNENGVGLIGPDLTELPDSVATYTCPVCEKWHDEPLKQYLYLGNLVIALCAHPCSLEQGPVTDAVPMWKRAEV